MKTLQNRAYFQGMFINDDISRFQIILNGIHYHNFVTGIMVIFWLLVFIGRVVNSQPAALMVDVIQAVSFGGKIMAVIIRAVSYGVFG